MSHRADRVIDSDSQATVRHRGPKHRSFDNEQERTRQHFREELAYSKWCWSHGLDPEDTSSIIAYEGAVGWLYLDDREDHR